MENHTLSTYGPVTTLTLNFKEWSKLTVVNNDWVNAQPRLPNFPK